ncbi:MAG TPA: hypothetical protein VF139_04100 [Candidatus Polarisedimenticolaceae bacterium]
MSGPDPILDALARLRRAEAPRVDVASRVMARVAVLSVPARPERRYGLGVAASIAFALTASAAGAQLAGPLRSAAADVVPAILAVVRGFAIAAAAATEALVRIAGGLDGVRALGQATGVAALAAAGSLAFLLLAREIRRAPALARSSR